MNSLLSPFRSRPFAWLLLGQFLSIIGDRLNYLALVGSLAQRTQRFAGSGGAGALSGLAVALLLPSALLSPWVAGRLDLWRRRDVLVMADSVRAVVALALAWGAAAALPGPGLLGLVGMSAAANVFFLPARIAVVADLVDAPDYNAANALGLLASVLATVFGSLLGARVVARAGVPGALLLDAASFAFSVWTLLRLPRGAAPRTEELTNPPGAAAGVRSLLPGRRGFAALLGSRRTIAATGLLAVTWAVGALLHVCGTLKLQMLTPRVTDLLGPTMALLGAGGAAGALLGGRRMQRGRSWLCAGALLFAAVALAAFGEARGSTVIFIAGFGAGFAATPLYILSDTEIQESLPADRRGEALAARDFICKTTFLVVVLGLGAASAANASGWILAGAALVALLGAGLAAWRPLAN